MAATAVFAHEGHHHHDEPARSRSEQEIRDEKLKRIGVSYLAQVKPIFQKACFDCHSNQTRYPSYYKIPGIRQLIDSDIAESKKHLDFSNDFPFKSHASVEEDLKAIGDEVREGDMPPFRYRILHSRQKLTKEDKAAISTWVSESAAILK
ncbi:MAG: heme-binding domain-containing protein [Bdellovibrionales bacterium]|nr:heme-binding domain-containing protein [Bdellovibrionales bacterium]